MEWQKLRSIPSICHAITARSSWAVKKSMCDGTTCFGRWFFISSWCCSEKKTATQLCMHKLWCLGTAAHTTWANWNDITHQNKCTELCHISTSTECASAKKLGQFTTILSTSHHNTSRDSIKKCSKIENSKMTELKKKVVVEIFSSVLNSNRVQLTIKTFQMDCVSGTKHEMILWC